MLMYLQQGAIDFVAMTIGAAAAACIAPLKVLMPSKPDAVISTAPKFVIMAISYSFGFAVQTTVVIMLCQQSWYKQDTGTTHYVSMTYCIACLPCDSARTLLLKTMTQALLWREIACFF